MDIGKIGGLKIDYLHFMYHFSFLAITVTFSISN